MNSKLFEHINPSELMLLFDFSPEIQFWIKDDQCVFQWVNKPFLDNYALKDLSEVIGKTDFDLSPYYLAEQFQRDDQSVLQGNPIVNRFEFVISFDNTIYWNVTNKRPITSAMGEIVGTYGITRKVNNQEDTEIPIDNLSKTVQYIHENIHKSINIKDMSALMHCSVSTLERRFKNFLHASPIEFIRKVKIQYACKALTNSDSLITDIAFSLGYADQSHFIREFKRMMMLTPLQYRKQFLLSHKK